MDPQVPNPSSATHGNFPEIARKVVYDCVREGLDKTDLHVKFSQDDVYIVSFTFILGCWKALVSTKLPNAQYYEVTCNAAKGEIYIDTYFKVSNVSIPIIEL